MAQGDSVKGLIEASKTRGWDPMVIPARGDKPAHSIADFDKAPDRPNYGSTVPGPIPNGNPDGWPDGTENDGLTNPGLREFDIAAKPTFRSAPFERENENRRTRAADPFPDMPGAR